METTKSEYVIHVNYSSVLQWAWTDMLPSFNTNCRYNQKPEANCPILSFGFVYPD